MFEKSTYWYYCIENKWWKFQEVGRIRQEKSGGAHKEIMESSSTILFRILHSAAIQSTIRNRNSYAPISMHCKLFSTGQLISARNPAAEFHDFGDYIESTVPMLPVFESQNWSKLVNKVDLIRNQIVCKLMILRLPFFYRMQGCHRRNGLHFMWSPSDITFH